MYGSHCFWRETMQTARIGPFDARLVIFLAALLLFPSVLTAVLLAVALVAFWGLERAGLRFQAAVLGFRAMLAGPLRCASRMPPRASITFTWEGPDGGYVDISRTGKPELVDFIADPWHWRAAFMRIIRRGRLRAK